MNIDKLYESNYLKAADLEGKPRRVTIREVKLEELGQDENKEAKLVMYFEGASKGLVLNKTNTMMVAGKFGKETDKWPGAVIELHSEKVSYQGNLVDGLRIRHIAEAAATDEPVPF
jgi:hypothetical protein